MKRLAIATLTVAALALFGGCSEREAHAHLVAKPQASTLKAREASQKENLAHARYVCRRGSAENRRWHCVWTRILVKELAETRTRLTPPAPQSPSAIRALICQVFGPECYGAVRLVECETGGTFDPTIVGNSRGADPYYGLFQFGAYARSRYGFGWDAASQIYAAKRMRDAESWTPWPVCSRIAGLR